MQDILQELLAYLQQIVLSHERVVFASSLGAEDMVLTDVIAKHQLPIQIFTLDTGRLPEATHRLLARIEEHYRLSIKVYFPQSEAVETLIATQGNNGFYHSIEGRQACCRARKVWPLARALEGQEAWVTGLRKAQSQTRHSLSLSAWDDDHGLQKYNPLLNWSHDQIWEYIRVHHVPYNALHDQNYPSIGCAPCTREVQPGEDERSGRWWWEHPESKECGLHLSQPER